MAAPDSLEALQRAHEAILQVHRRLLQAEALLQAGLESNYDEGYKDRVYAFLEPKPAAGDGHALAVS